MNRYPHAFIGVLTVFALTHSLSMGNEPQLPPIQKAKALKPGDTICFVAPSRALERPAMKLAGARLETLGFKVKYPDGLFTSNGYLAGSDEHRTKQLMDAFTDDQVDAVFPGAGGFGATRILDRLDYDILRQHPKVLIGYSDITALHIAIHQKTGLITFHSPVPSSGLGSEGGLAPIAKRTFWRSLLASSYSKSQTYAIQVEPNDGINHPPVNLVPGKAEGRLIGGNLSILAAMMGTPYQVETAGNILFIEDIGEAPYRVDRMLQTMKSAGLLDNCAGVVIGAFTRRDSEDTSNETTSMDEVLRGYFQDAQYPVLMNFPVGHQPNNCTLPQGAMVRLDADAGSIELLESPVRIPK